MKPDINEIEKVAQGLPCKQRAKLVRRLIASLERIEDQDIKRYWIDEVERRLADYETGKIEAIPAEKVFANIRKGVKS